MLDVETQYIVEPQNVAATQNIASLRKGKFGQQSQNLGSVIRGFKISVTKYAGIKNISFAWQPRFYDHIVRSEEDLNRIRDYIVVNPENWDKDEENKNVNP